MALGKNNQKKEVQKDERTYEVTVLRATQLESGAVGFDMEVNGVKIYNCFAKTMQNKKSGEYFTAIDFPQYKGKNGNYYSYAWFPISFSVIEKIEEQINSLLG